MKINNIQELPHYIKYKREYKSWLGMKSRCNNVKDTRYKDYGEKGVKVSLVWANDFFKFLADLGERPPNHTLDRIDPFGDYTPENCRWASHKTQANNKRNTKKYTLGDITKTHQEWADSLKITWETLDRRIKLFSLEKALTTPRRNYP